MTDDDARRLITEWRRRADHFRRLVREDQRGRCHEPDRALRRGLAAMADACADDLGAVLARVPTHADA